MADAHSPVTWKAHEYHHFERSTDWYWAVALVAVCICALSIFFGNYIFALLIIVAAASLTLHAAKSPELTSFELNEEGIKIISMNESILYPYKNLEAFCVEEHKDENNELIHAKLLVKSKHFFMPFIVIIVDEITPGDVRRHLIRHLQEHDLYEPLGQRVMEYLGF